MDALLTDCGSLRACASRKPQPVDAGTLRADWGGELSQQPAVPLGLFQGHGCHLVRVSAGLG